MRVVRAFVTVAIALVAEGCASGDLVGPSTLRLMDGLITTLRQQGATVSRGDALPPLPCLSRSGQVLVVNGGNVSVFEYASNAAADRDAAQVSPDGSGVRGGGCAVLISWIGPPHFYKSDRLIVVYAGSDDNVLLPLEAVLGKPFASR